MSLKELLAQHTAPAAEALVQQEEDGAVRCLACGHRCRILSGREGVCRVRFNRDGELRVPWGYVAGLAVDPIEKKPFHHALPGQEALSFGMLGCNLHCPFCQNWDTSQTLRDSRSIARPSFIEPERIAQLALENGCPVLCSTYNEPLISADWAVAALKLVQPSGLLGAFVSNGHATPEALAFLRPYVKLLNIDLKAFREETYHRLGGVLAHVTDTIRRAKEMDFWVEVVTLVVPGMNDSDEELREIASFVAGVSPDIPWHISAFHPMYKMTNPPRTPVETIERAYALGKQAGLKFVYPGNVAGAVGELENTLCPECGRTLIERRGFFVSRNTMDSDRCPDCGTVIPGVWEAAGPTESSGEGHPRPAQP